MPVTAPTAVPETGTGDPVAAQPSRSRRRLWRAGPPISAYLLGNLIYVIASTSVYERYFTFGSRVRADSGLYAAIAHHGYELFRCQDDPTLAPIFPADAWCGTTGWFPLYPWLMRMVNMTTGFQLGEYESGLVISEVSTLVAMFLGWGLIRRATGLGDLALDGPWRDVLRRHSRQLGVLALMVALPAGVYLHAVFPMALGAALATGVATLLFARRWAWAGLVGAGVAMAYPIGVVVAAIGAGAVLTALRRRELTPRRAALALVAVSGGPVLGLLGVFLTHHLAVGRWNGYMLIQDHYGNGVNDPVVSFTRLINEKTMIPIAEPRRDMIPVLDWATDVELLAALLLVLLLVAVCWHAGPRNRPHPVDVGLTLYAAAVFVAPLVAGPAVSQYRSHVLMLPALLVLRHVRARFLWPLVLGSGVVALVMGQLFYVWLLF
jgi:hypothetical protein